MKKLIELDATLDVLREVIVPAEDIGFGDELTDGYNDGIDMAVTVVSGLTTVDAVEVVRCKDCKHNRACEIQYHAQAGDLFFCGAAERKDGDHHADS